MCCVTRGREGGREGGRGGEGGREVGEGGREGRGGREGGEGRGRGRKGGREDDSFIHILIGMFNSNPMTPLSVLASMGLRL